MPSGDPGWAVLVHGAHGYCEQPAVARFLDEVSQLGASKHGGQTLAVDEIGVGICYHARQSDSLTLPSTNPAGRGGAESLKPRLTRSVEHDQDNGSCTRFS